jgi:tyrosinase
LQTECKYKGAQPYWDWSLDNPENGGAQFNNSPIFDPITGFGGNGKAGFIPIPPPVAGQPPPGTAGTPIGSCVTDGPFANFTVVLNPGPVTNGLTAGSRCLERNFQTHTVDISSAWNANVVPLLNLEVFTNFTLGMDFDIGKTGAPAGIHGAGHQGVGGEVKLPIFNVSFIFC